MQRQSIIQKRCYRAADANWPRQSEHCKQVFTVPWRLHQIPERISVNM